MGSWAGRDSRPGDDWSLGQFYALVPDAYEFDLLEDARRCRDDLFSDESEPSPADPPDDRGPTVVAMGPDDASPSITQAQFMVERLLGGEVVDDRRS